MSSDSVGRRRPSAAEDPSGSRIPVPRPCVFRRTASLRSRGEKAPLTTPSRHLYPTITEQAEPWQHRQPARHHSLHSLSLEASRPHTAQEEHDDLDSLRSFGSACSTASCDHAFFARNGTTFSGRRMKYVVHCSSHSGGTDEYLTPTQRANRQIRRLKTLLHQAQKDLEQKDEDIFRLTKEVVELRVFKASLPPGTSAPMPPDTKDEEGEGKDEVDKSSELPLSLADSGHYEDLSSNSPSPGDETHRPFESPEDAHTEFTESCNSPEEACRAFEPRSSPGKADRVASLYEKRLEELQHRHVDECQELKERHNNKVEGLLQRLSDVNSRYCELRTEHDRTQDRIRELEKEAESLKKSLDEQEERHKSMYLKMYIKGQEAARFEHADQVLEFAHQAPSRVSVPELLRQLQVTEAELENVKDKDFQQSDKTKPSLLSAKEAVSLWLLGTRKAMYRRIVESRASNGELDPEITLQFLKSAIYYFLTDKENHQGHLNAIESILGYSDAEKLNIERAYKSFLRK